MTGFLKKIFQKRSPEVPDNTRLLKLLSNYWKSNGAGKTYEKVVLELMHGNCFLLLPTRDFIQTGTTDWHITAANQKIDLASVYTVDGHQVLAGFTDERALLQWSKKPCPYISIKGLSILELCESNNFSSLVINNASENTFVLERRPEPVEHYEIKEGTTVQIGIPNTPLEPAVIDQLLAYFKSISDIQEVYHHGQTVNKEFTLVLGFKLNNSKPEIETSIVATVQRAIAYSRPAYPLDVHFFESGEDYGQVKALENALIYKRLS